MHKHFRMISIYNNMRSLGFAPEEAQHTRIPGAWRKLNQLFDLRALDERENAYAFQEDPDPFDPEDAYNLPDFELPEEEFGELMWQKRFHGPESEASSSPPPIPIEEDKALYHPGIGLLHDLPDGPKSRRTATPTAQKSGKATRASRATTKSGKGAKATPASKNKAQTESEEEEEDDEDEEDDDSAVESEAETAPSTRRTNRSGNRAKPAPKRTRKR